MSRIFEALDSARHEARWRQSQFDVPRPMPVAIPARSATPAMFSSVNMEDEMVCLHQHLDALLPADRSRMLQFIGSREGEGTSTVVHEFARVSATRFAERVLLLEMDGRRLARKPRGVIADPSSPETSPFHAGTTTMFIAPYSEGCVRNREPFSMRFDLILVDAPPAAVSPDGFEVSGDVDGVVLVLEAEETRWPVADRVKESIQRSGGRVLGVVFNKRRYYIPQLIYRQL